MKTVSQVLITITGKAGNPYQALQRAAESQGWAYSGSQDHFGDELRLYRSSSTPLDLGLLPSPTQTDCYAIIFVQSWMRCTLAGGWAKPGYLPDDLARKIIAALSQSGWSVEET